MEGIDHFKAHDGQIEVLVERTLYAEPWDETKAR